MLLYIETKKNIFVSNLNVTEKFFLERTFLITSKKGKQKVEFLEVPKKYSLIFTNQY